MTAGVMPAEPIEQDGIQRVTQAPKILALPFREFHRPHCKDCRAAVAGAVASRPP